VNKHKNLHRQSRQARHFPIPTRVQFLEDPLGRHTLIELVTTDRAGLLSQIGQAFIKQHINLHSAKITTIGSRAEDLFYVTDPHNQPITDVSRQQQIHDEMLAMLDFEH
ncbi:MAG: [protein-PII] uridylyltransferase, partial [Methylovulum sp.]|nr:[protein-PII] uridylyltransferase [Methylovulum sp.]